MGDWQERVRRFEEEHEPKQPQIDPKDALANLQEYCNKTSRMNREIIAGLGINEILGEIREVWREGEIVDVNQKYSEGPFYFKGVELRSDPFPVVFTRISNTSGKMSEGQTYSDTVSKFDGAEIKQIRAALRIELWGPGLKIYNWPFHWMEPSTLNGLVNFVLVQDELHLRSVGSMERLYEDSPGNLAASRFTGDDLTFSDLTSQDTKNMVEKALVQSELERKKLHSYPQQLREEAARLLSTMPPQFLSQGYGTTNDFIRWAPHLFASRLPWHKRFI